MAAKPTRLTHKIAIQLHLVAESCTICSSRSRRQVRKLLNTRSRVCVRERERESYEPITGSESVGYMYLELRYCACSDDR
jgi:hypothetical protein